MDNETMTTREAARYLNLSTVVLLRKADLLGGVKDGRGWYRWPKDRIEAYKRAVVGKGLNDPTRGKDLERE